MLLLPGPVEVPEVVMDASASVMNHRSDAFREIVGTSEEMLNRFADSARSVMTTGSGTLAVESMIYSLLSPGDEVLSISFGEFGGRLVESLNRRGAMVSVVEKSFEDIIERGEIEDLASRNRNLSAVCLVHNETGNGTCVRNLKNAAREARDAGLKVLVDSVSGFGGMEIKADSWGIDAIATCSQKGLASVPGIGIVSIGKSGMEHLDGVSGVPVYLDLKTSVHFLDRKETPFTPSTGGFRALQTALRILEAEGIENRWRRHEAAASFVREQLLGTGSTMYGNRSNYSDTVPAFRPPVPVAKLLSDARKEGYEIARGMKSYADSMIRVGLLGVVSSRMIAGFLNAYFMSVGSERRIDASAVPAGAGFDPRILDRISD